MTKVDTTSATASCGLKWGGRDAYVVSQRDESLHDFRYRLADAVNARDESLHDFRYGKLRTRVARTRGLRGEPT